MLLVLMAVLLPPLSFCEGTQGERVEGVSLGEVGCLESMRRTYLPRLTIAAER